jgi:hypothetical protein
MAGRKTTGERVLSASARAGRSRLRFSAGRRARPEPGPLLSVRSSAVTALPLRLAHLRLLPGELQAGACRLFGRALAGVFVRCGSAPRGRAAAVYLALTGEVVRLELREAGDGTTAGATRRMGPGRHRRHGAGVPGAASPSPDRPASRFAEVAGVTVVVRSERGPTMIQHLSYVSRRAAIAVGGGERARTRDGRHLRRR